MENSGVLRTVHRVSEKQGAGAGMTPLRVFAVFGCGTHPGASPHIKTHIDKKRQVYSAKTRIEDHESSYPSKPPK